jgi:hypothetical protein
MSSTRRMGGTSVSVIVCSMPPVNRENTRCHCRTNRTDRTDRTHRGYALGNDVAAEGRVPLRSVKQRTGVFAHEVTLLPLHHFPHTVERSPVNGTLREMETVVVGEEFAELSSPHKGVGVGREAVAELGAGRMPAITRTDLPRELQLAHLSDSRRKVSIRGFSSSLEMRGVLLRNGQYAGQALRIRLLRYQDVGGRLRPCRRFQNRPDAREESRANTRKPAPNRLGELKSALLNLISVRSRQVVESPSRLRLSRKVKQSQAPRRALTVRGVRKSSAESVVVLRPSFS